MKDLNLQSIAIKLPEENIMDTLQDISLGQEFTEDARNTGNWSRNKQMELHHARSFCTAKETFNIINHQEKGRKYVQIMQLIENSHPRSIMRSRNSVITNNPVKNEAKDKNSHFSQDEFQMTDRHEELLRFICIRESK